MLPLAALRVESYFETPFYTILSCQWVDVAEEMFFEYLDSGVEPRRNMDIRNSSALANGRLKLSSNMIWVITSYIDRKRQWRLSENQQGIF